MALASKGWKRSAFSAKCSGMGPYFIELRTSQQVRKSVSADEIADRTESVEVINVYCLIANL
jgi:hypothetical protein